MLNKIRRLSTKKRHNKRKTYRLSHKKRIKGGDNILDVPIKSILLTDPIFKAIKKLNPEFKPSGFKKDPGSHGFVLHKLNQNQDLSLPIKVKTLDDFPGYYSIVDGRHRFAKLVAHGDNSISIIINK